jgi:uncharacterized membrane protein YbjE (DUF340 family)
MKRMIFATLSLILFLVLTVAISARLGWWPLSATAMPPQWESAFGQATLQASLSRPRIRMKRASTELRGVE